MKTYLDNARAFLNQYANTLDDLWGTGYYAYVRFCEQNNITFAHGVARFVFVGEDFVIKFNYGDRDKIKWAGGCLEEYKCYKQFEADNMDYLLCPLTRMKGGHHFYYVMPRVTVAYEEELDEDDYWRNISRDEAEYIDRYVHDIHNENFGFYEGSCVLIDYAWNTFK